MAKPPAVLAPPAGALLPAVLHDRVPVAVGLLLIVRRDLEGERLALLELRTTVETEAGDPQDGELYGQHIALLASRKVTGRRVDCAYFTVRERGGIEPSRLFGVLVKPQADRVLRDHGGVLRRSFDVRRVANSVPVSVRGVNSQSIAAARLGSTSALNNSST